MGGDRSLEGSSVQACCLREELLERDLLFGDRRLFAVMEWGRVDKLLAGVVTST